MIAHLLVVAGIVVLMLIIFLRKPKEEFSTSVFITGRPNINGQANISFIGSPKDFPKLNMVVLRQHSKYGKEFEILIQTGKEWQSLTFYRSKSERPTYSKWIRASQSERPEHQHFAVAAELCEFEKINTLIQSLFGGKTPKIIPPLPDKELEQFKLLIKTADFRICDYYN